MADDSTRLIALCDTRQKTWRRSLPIARVPDTMTEEMVNAMLFNLNETMGFLSPPTPEFHMTTCVKLREVPPADGIWLAQSMDSFERAFLAPGSQMADYPSDLVQLGRKARETWDGLLRHATEIYPATAGKSQDPK